MSGVTVTTTGRLASRVWDEEASRQLGDVVKVAISERTFELGQDVNDQAFQHYSAGYALERVGNLQSQRVTLVATGALRNAVEHSATDFGPDGFKLVLDGEQGAKAAALMEKRPFWGISPRDRAKIRAALPRIMAGAMARSRAVEGL